MLWCVYRDFALGHAGTRFVDVAVQLLQYHGSARACAAAGCGDDGVRFLHLFCAASFSACMLGWACRLNRGQAVVCGGCGHFFVGNADDLFELALSCLQRDGGMLCQVAGISL